MPECFYRASRGTVDNDVDWLVDSRQKRAGMTFHGAADLEQGLEAFLQVGKELGVI